MQKKSPKSKQKALNNGLKTCLFLAIMAYIIAGLMVILNLFIAYTVVTYFLGDGFSFMGGLFIGASFIVTIPVNVIAIIFASKIKSSPKKHTAFYLAFGVILILVGFILHKATELWPFILGFGILVSIASLVCQNPKKGYL